MHRLDANTSGLMVVAKSERAYRVLKQAFRDREVDKRYHALVQGHPIRCAAPSTRPSAGIRPGTAGSRWSRAAARASPTTTRWRLSARPAWKRSSSRPGGPTRSGCTWRRLRHPCAGDRLYGADPVLAAHLGLTRQWLHAVRLGFAHPADGRRVEFTSEYSPDLAHALAILQEES